jgi:hypothetical protein
MGHLAFVATWKNEIKNDEISKWRMEDGEFIK